MKAPYTWLQEYVPDAPPSGEVAERLALVGTEVERVAPFGVPNGSNGGGDAYRVGTVLEFEQHPDADRLRLCQIDVGEGEPRQIVCGATNFSQGDRVAVVLPGGHLPDGTKIKKAKLRGVESHGMMLSERELGLSADHSGLMILPSEWQNGEPLLQHMPLADEVLELEVTSNRPDILSIAGVARELATAFDLELHDPLAGDVDATGAGSVEDHVSVTVEATDLCPRYMARAFVDVKVGQSPAWLKARLAAAGMRAINNVVDVTNYVMLATGQPLHAFDGDKLRGQSIVVRRAKDGEKVTTLDDMERTLDSSMLAICDTEGVGVIAGIMGAEDVEVSDGTTRIVLEAACFDGPTILRTSHRLALRSESSSRFEKKLDPHLPEVALKAASRLLVELCGATLVPGTIDVIAGDLPQSMSIDLPAQLLARTLGVDVPGAMVVTLLEGLGYTVTPSGDGWNVGVPHWRMFDTTRPIDLVEEVGRMWGLDRIPSTLPARKAALGTLSKAQRLQRQLEDAATGIGLHECLTYSLVTAGDGDALGLPADSIVALSNPMTAEHSELRGTLVGSMLDVVAHNQSLGADRIALFETGRTFARSDSPLSSSMGTIYADERRVLAVSCAGTLWGDHLGQSGVAADFAAVSGIVDSLTRSVGVPVEIRPFASGSPKWLHPGRSGAVVLGDTEIGWVGELHPQLTKDADVRGTVAAAEFELQPLVDHQPEVITYSHVSTFPPVRQDVALIVKNDVAANDVLTIVRAEAGDLLEHVACFDRYEGDPIPSGSYSLALKLTFRAPDRTLTDDEVAQVRNRIVSALSERLGAQLRGS
jgi:phenylalanyl-tRNA synthetase beta chain